MRNPEYLFFLSLPLLTCFPLITIARMKPTPLPSSLSGVPSPSPPPHKLELQTLKLEELTVSVGSNFPGWPPLSVGTQKSNPIASAPLEIQEPRSPVPPLSVSNCPAPASACSPEPAQHRLSPTPTLGLRAPAAAAPAGPPGVRNQVDPPGAHARRRPAPRAAQNQARGMSCGCFLATPQAQGSGHRPAAGLGEGGGPMKRRQSGAGREVENTIANEMGGA